MKTEPIGVTFVVPENQDAMGVYESENGIEVFETDAPYLLSDGKSLVNPLLVKIVDGPVFLDAMGNAQAAMAVSGLWSLADLFANGEKGFWLPYQPDRLYADVDKTVPATIGGGIASFDDLSGNGVTGPQPTSTARPIFRASPERGEYDLADDVLPKDATLPAITDGTVILIGQYGIWIDEGYSFAGGNWSFGPTTYSNGPTGIIGVVGDMLDLVVLDRPLTADERDSVVDYGVERGSAGALMPSGAGIISLMRPTVNTAPEDWVRYHDGKSYADGAEWQSVIDASPAYTGITSEVIDGQHMVRVPKFWVKTQDTAAGGVIYSISDTPQPGFQVHPAFFNAGDEIDQFWIGAYHASENVEEVFESQPNVLPRVSLSGVTAIERMEARNTGGQTGWGSLTWHQICAVKLLCLIEIGTPDPRTVIGQGWNNATSNFGSGAARQPTGTGDANWRGIYDLWGNVQTLTTGLEFRDRRAWLADENGDLVDTDHVVPGNRYIGACAGGDLAWAFLPTADGPTASSAGYTSYQWIITSGTRAARHGGAYNAGPVTVGLFSLYAEVALAASGSHLGFRLAKV